MCVCVCSRRSGFGFCGRKHHLEETNITIRGQYKGKQVLLSRRSGRWHLGWFLQSECSATAALFTSSQQAPATFIQLTEVSLGFRERFYVLLLLSDLKKKNCAGFKKADQPAVQLASHSFIFTVSAQSWNYGKDAFQIMSGSCLSCLSMILCHVFFKNSSVSKDEHNESKF